MIAVDMQIVFVAGSDQTDVGFSGDINLQGHFNSNLPASGPCIIPERYVNRPNTEYGNNN